MLAATASPMEVAAIMIPYQRRSGTNQCWPVSVTIGVTSKHRNRQISAPVPSVSSTDTAKVLLFSDSSAGSIKNSGTGAGRPSRTSATAFRLIREPPNLKSTSIHSSTRLLGERRCSPWSAAGFLAALGVTEWGAGRVPAGGEG